MTPPVSIPHVTKKTQMGDEASTTVSMFDGNADFVCWS
jgi:hypothetical protein